MLFFVLNIKYRRTSHTLAGSHMHREMIICDGLVYTIQSVITILAYLQMSTGSRQDRGKTCLWFSISVTLVDYRNKQKFLTWCRHSPRIVTPAAIILNIVPQYWHCWFCEVIIIILKGHFIRSESINVVPIMSQNNMLSQCL